MSDHLRIGSLREAVKLSRTVDEYSPFPPENTVAEHKLESVVSGNVCTPLRAFQVGTEATDPTDKLETWVVASSRLGSQSMTRPFGSSRPPISRR